MKKYAFIMAIVSLSLLLVANCTGANLRPYVGIGSSTHPVQQYEYPYAIGNKGGLVYHNYLVEGRPSEGVGNSKTGEACSYSVLWMVSFGDSSIIAAKSQANIQKISNLSHEISGILGYIFHSHCTIIKGE
ncbi:MAG: TRL-like family protein [Leptospira sp.]|nr:TRL-like family protein [Leptospira sp.]